MSDNLPAVAVLGAVATLLVVTTGLVLTGAVGLPGSGGDSAPPPSTDRSTPTATPGPPFTLDTRDIEECGMLCRNVTSTVTNERGSPARDVTIQTRLYAGNDTGNEVRWQHTERVDRIEAGETFRTTRRVDLSLEAALAIREADGWVTIRTRVGSIDQRVTVTDRVQVD